MHAGTCLARVAEACMNEVMMIDDDTYWTMEDIHRNIILMVGSMNNI
jgi:hypothetical protein